MTSPLSAPSTSFPIALQSKAAHLLIKVFPWLALAGCAGAELVDAPALGVRLERGFRISQFADERLANDVWCMALNPRGEVVVSGAGYIRTLLDTNGDGRADEALPFANIARGAMGICFGEGGKQVLVMADGWLSEYRDDNLDRIADGAPRKLFPFAGGEHAGHAIRRGPDGWWWVIGGNDAGIDKLLPPAAEGAPFLAGALVRISPDFSKIELVAGGFRNAYDFDFDAQGRVFTFDSDCESDYFLPWYSGCAIYEVKPGLHHGWRLAGWMRSFRVPDYMPSTVPALADIGRGSPTGVVVSRSAKMPAHYRGGLFLADWTFGRIYHVPAGSKRPEVFLEPIGTAGFAPTDIVETEAGALFVSIGGRKTRGSVFRIEPDGTELAVQPVVPVVETPAAPELARLAKAQDALGGWRLVGASAEAFVAYEAAKPEGLAGPERAAALELGRAQLTAADFRIQTEAARLLAMLEDDSPASLGGVLASITEKSSATRDFHALACMARLRGTRTPEITAGSARAILNLERKLAGGDQRPKQNWGIRLNEVVSRMIERDPALADSLVGAADFATPGHLALVDALPAVRREAAARAFLAAANANAAFEWTPELVRLISTLPGTRPLLRGKWSSPALRPALREVLKRDATAEDLALMVEPPPPPLGDVAGFAESLKPIVWEQGDAARGGRIFRDRACAVCHVGTSPLGPELAGPVARLSASDLLTEIQFPSRNIAEAFQATLFTLKDGTTRVGLIAFDSADGVLIHTGPGTTERLAESDIASRDSYKTSFMPPGLLSGLKPADLADLTAYLRTLRN
ncbi:MAG: hypothetical protein Q8Q59_00965 [Luteolibacter sp.]|jgi:putative heme-binding domain-containing protein|nr:hypothetical protein [Luteolibacter sp.]